MSGKGFKKDFFYFFKKRKLNWFWLGKRASKPVQIILIFKNRQLTRSFFLSLEKEAGFFLSSIPAKKKTKMKTENFKSVHLSFLLRKTLNKDMQK